LLSLLAEQFIGHNIKNVYSISEVTKMGNNEDQVMQNKHLYAQQSFVTRQSVFQEPLTQHLQEIKQLLSEHGQPGPFCQISYAWPSKENEEKEFWLQPFLHGLYDHLTVAGIHVSIDFRDIIAGDDVNQFIQELNSGSHIILIMTESLLQKHKSVAYNPTQTELAIIERRLKTDLKIFGRDDRVHQILLSDTMDTAYPDILNAYATGKIEARKFDYVGLLENIVAKLFEQRLYDIERKVAYTRLWQTFHEKFPIAYHISTIADIEREIAIGYHAQKLHFMQKSLQYRCVQAQRNVKYNDKIFNKAPYSSQESFSQHGQKFQWPGNLFQIYIKRQVLWNKMIGLFTSQERTTLALTGLGGSGKTELARRYYKHPPIPYNLRAWFNAETKEELLLQYIDLAKENDVDFSNEMTFEQQGQLAKKWLLWQKNCLLVYDNVPNIISIDGLLPGYAHDGFLTKDSNHHVLITSRSSVDWPLSLNVDVMTEEEAIDLIVEMTGRDRVKNFEKIKQLVKTLGCLPLAVAQAGAYIGETVRISDYIDLYKQHKHQIELLSNIDETSFSPIHEPVWTTFDKNFDTLEINLPTAMQTLKQASWLAANEIPERLLFDLLLSNSVDQIRASLIWDDIKEQIQCFSFMHIYVQLHHLSIHPLLQDILRARQIKDEQLEIFQKVSSAVEKLLQQYDKNDIHYKNLMPHVLRLQEHSKYIVQLINEQGVGDRPLLFSSMPTVCSEVSIAKAIELNTQGMQFYRNKE
jgi:hypothetical protein